MTKTHVEKTEFWLSLVAGAGVSLAAATTHLDKAAPRLALAVTAVLALVFAVFQTPLVDPKRPGVTTKAFWIAMATVVGLVATAIAETDIAGLPAQVTQTAGMIAAGGVAFGYNVWRYMSKVVDPDIEL